jgi:Kef-type K+ transport system membrane component KefB
VRSPRCAGLAAHPDRERRRPPLTLDLPLANPVLVMAVATAAFLAAPFLGRLARLPSIVVLIGLGALVGPAGLRLLERGETIVLLGTIGLLYLLFQAGLELDLRGFLRHRRRSLTLGGLSFALPLLLALAVAPMLGYGVAAVLLIGAIVASHTLLAYPIAARLGIARDPAVTTAVGGTILTDVLSLTLLAIVTGMSVGDGGPWVVLRALVVLAATGVAIVLLLPRAARWFFRRTDGEASARYVFMLTAMLASAAAAEAAGAAPIIGAFLAGLSLNRLVPNASTVMARVRFVGDAVFIPFFLLSVGMLVDLRVLASLEVLGLAIVLVALVFVGKGGAALIAGRLLGFDRRQGWLMVGLTVPQAAATLAVTFVGLELGLFGPVVVNAVIALILVSCLVGATLVERAGRALVLARPAGSVDGEAPHRVLVPVANPATAERLLDVAFLLREAASEEAVYPVSVVRDEGDVEARVAQAERVLAHAIVYAAEAEVPVVPLTRVAVNPAVGIVQAAREQRITDVVLGWRGGSSTRRATYGGIIDQVIEHGESQVLIAQLGRPIAATARVYLVLPPAIDYNPGFYGAIATVKRLVIALGAPIEAIAVKTDARRLERRFAEVPGELTLTFGSADSWTALLRSLQDRIRPEDLVVLISARRGTVAWAQALERLPVMLAGLGASFLGIVPSDAELDVTPAEIARSGGGVSGLLRPERLLLDLDDADLGATLGALLGRLLPTERREFRATLRALVEDDVGYATELLPGALVSHVRSRAVAAPALAIGVHRRGVLHPRGGEPRHLVLVLVSPQDGPAQAHLARLANVVQRVHEVGAERLAAARSAAELIELLRRAP